MRFFARALNVRIVDKFHLQRTTTGFIDPRRAMLAGQGEDILTGLIVLLRVLVPA
jgi:hypothetical protein